MGNSPSAGHVDAAGLSIAYRRAGTGPPIVLLHGIYQDSRSWAPQLAGLCNEFTAIALDLPGCGQSGDPPDGYTRNDYADTIAACFTTLGLDRPVVVGLSFGSVLTMALYDRHPESVRALVLASAYAGWAGSLPPEEVDRRLRQVTAELDLPRDAALRAWLPTLVTPSAPPESIRLISAMFRDSRTAGVRAALDAFGRADLRSVLPRISVPTLLLYGDADVRSPVGAGESLHAAVRGSTLHVITDAPHLVNLEQPSAFNANVRHFAAQVAIPDGR